MQDFYNLMHKWLETIIVVIIAFKTRSLGCIGIFVAWVRVRALVLV